MNENIKHLRDIIEHGLPADDVQRSVQAEALAVLDMLEMDIRDLERSQTVTTPRPDQRDRYITCAVKVNGHENGRTEILDTHIDGGEGEPLIVASFFDRGEAEFFCRAANREWKRCSMSPKPDPDPTIDEDRCSECGARSLNKVCPACQEENVRILNDPTRGRAL